MSKNDGISTLVEGSVDAWRQDFLRDLSFIRRKGKSVQLSDKQIDEIFFSSKWIKKASPAKIFLQRLIKALKFTIYGFALLICLCVSINQMQPIYEVFQGASEYLNNGDYIFTGFTRLFAIRTGPLELMVDLHS